MNTNHFGAPHLPAEDTAAIRQALRRLRDAQNACMERPSALNATAANDAAMAVARQIPKMPWLITDLDNQVQQLVGLVMGMKDALTSKQWAIAEAGLIEICPDTYAGMKDAIALYGGTMAGRA